MDGCIHPRYNKPIFWPVHSYRTSFANLSGSQDVYKCTYHPWVLPFACCVSVSFLTCQIINQTLCLPLTARGTWRKECDGVVPTHSWFLFGKCVVWWVLVPYCFPLMERNWAKCVGDRILYGFILIAWMCWNRLLSFKRNLPYLFIFCR